MKTELCIGIVGATGLIGSEIIGALEESTLDVEDLRLFASSDSVGEVYRFKSSECTVEPLDQESFAGIDIVFLAAPGDVVADVLPSLTDSKAVIIDVSGALRNQAQAIVFSPEVNGAPGVKNQRLFSIAAPVATVIAPVLRRLHELGGLVRYHGTILQSVASAGKSALDELWAQTIAIGSQREVVAEVFPFQVAFNCVPQIDIITESGETREEERVRNDLAQILGWPATRGQFTAVRIPVFHGVGIDLQAELSREVKPADLFAVLRDDPWFKLYEASTDCPQLLDVVGTGDIHLARVRVDHTVEHGLRLWLAADTVRFGAALAAVRCAELVVHGRAQYSAHN